MLKKELQNTGPELDFSGLGIKDSILKVIADLGLKTPTPIQHQAIPIALNGEDIVGIAQTGTGKTFAFGIPMLQRLALVKGRGLVLLPTRELAGQVENSLRSLGGPLGLRTVSLIGGEAIGRQLVALRRRPHILVATPGRLIDHLKRGSVHLDDISVLVLDEADMMFDMGFAPQIEEVLKRVPENRQTLLFSATMPPSVMKLAEKHLRAPLRIEVSPAGTTAELVEQEMYLLPRDDRWGQLLRLLTIYKESVLIFVRTKHGASKLAKKLQLEKFKAAEIHSNLSFPQRQAALAGFRSGQHRILVATDVAARGLDINDIELVLNFDLPDNSEDYVHRIGRTARAGKKGKAISFVAPDQRREIQKIEKLIRQNLLVTTMGSQASSRPFSRPMSQPASRPVSRPIANTRDRRPKVVKKFVQAREKNQLLKDTSSTSSSSHSSLGFRKRSEVVDVTATPDYLRPSFSRPESSFKRHEGRPVAKISSNFSRPMRSNQSVRPERSRRPGAPAHEIVPPIVNPSFEGGNRFAFRRAMYLLKEEAKGRPMMNRAPRTVVPKTLSRNAEPSKPGRQAVAFNDRKVGVRSSGFKIFKSGEGRANVNMVDSDKDRSPRSARPAFRAKSFSPRFKRK
jgi:ATP-dependent RNA helicase RhlE